MTTTIIVSPNEHPILVTLNQSNEHNGLHFSNYSQQILLPGDPKQQFHISKGGSIVVDELEVDDERAQKEREKRNPARGFTKPDDYGHELMREEERARARAPAD
jgi:hypothetical protein